MTFLQSMYTFKKKKFPLSLYIFIYITYILKTPQTKKKYKNKENGKKNPTCTPNSSSCFSYLRLHILLFHILALTPKCYKLSKI